MKIYRVNVEIAVPDYDPISEDELNKNVQEAIYESDKMLLYNLEVMPAVVVYDSDDNV